VNWTDVKKKYKDPVTGDKITHSEHITRVIQDKVIRTWWFLGFFTITTLWAISVTVYAGVHPTPLDWWNVWASWTAVIVEGLIGRYMTGQTRRDAKIVREIRSLLVEIRKLQTQDFQHQKEDYEVSLDINNKLSEVLDRLPDEEPEDWEPIEPWWGEYNE
jgi:hypothetical protein